MHFLICIGGEKYSRDTLCFGVRMAAALKADVSILFVRPRVSYFFKQEAQVAARKVEEWEIESAEVRVIQAVQEILEQENALRKTEGRVDVRHQPKAGIRGAFEYHLYGRQGENIRIRVREGDVVDSIVRETLETEFDVVLVGAPRDGGRLVRQIIQYIDTSVLIVKNPRNAPYRLLLCLDDSEASRKALDFGVRTARLLETSVDLLCIYSYPWEEHNALNVAERAQRLLKRFGVPCTLRLRRGAVARTILKESEAEHIVVMGSSEKPSLYQFFFGSTAVEIGRRGKSPVLVVK